MKKYLIYIFLILVIVSCVKDEYNDDKIDTTYVYGYVKDYNTEEAIQGVSIKVGVGDSDSPFSYWVYDSVVTNSSGYYEIKFNAYSDYWLSIAPNEKSSLPVIITNKDGYMSSFFYVYPEDIQKINFKLIKD